MMTISCRRSPHGFFQSLAISRHSSSSSGHSFFGTAAHHEPPHSVRHAGPAWLQEPARSLRVASQKKPLLRTTPGHSPWMHFMNRPGWNGRRARYTKLLMPYSSVSGVCSPRSSRSHPGDSFASSKSNNRVFRTSFKGTFPNAQSTNRARGLSARRIPRSTCNCSGVTRSDLFITITSANSTCSTSRSTTQRSSPSSRAAFRSWSDSAEP